MIAKPNVQNARNHDNMYNHVYICMLLTMHHTSPRNGNSWFGAVALVLRQGTAGKKLRPAASKGHSEFHLRPMAEMVNRSNRFSTSGRGKLATPTQVAQQVTHHPSSGSQSL